MKRSLVCTVLAIGFLTNIAHAQDGKIGSSSEPPQKEFRGEQPTQAQMESAYKNCLSDVDDEAASFKSGGVKKTHVDSESSICTRSRRNCVANPRSVDCRAFVDDYAG